MYHNIADQIDTLESFFPFITIRDEEIPLQCQTKFLFQANLRKKMTHSVQTNLSNYKRDNTTQSYPPKYVSFIGLFQKKKFVHLEGGGVVGYNIFSMIYPRTFLIFTPWTWIVPMDNHQFNPSRYQNLPPGHCDFKGCSWTPGQFILKPDPSTL